MDNFLPWEVVPCSKNNRTAIYEVDEDGKAYDNIYELRRVIEPTLERGEHV